MGQIPQRKGFPPHAPQASGTGEEQAHTGHADPEKALLNGVCCWRTSDSVFAGPARHVYMKQ